MDESERLLVLYDATHRKGYDRCLEIIRHKDHHTELCAEYLRLELGQPAAVVLVLHVYHLLGGGEPCGELLDHVLTLVCVHQHDVGSRAGILGTRWIRFVVVHALFDAAARL